MWFRLNLAVFLFACMFVTPVFAGVADEISEAIYETKDSKVFIKSEYRKCISDTDCTAVLSMCRWRAVDKVSEKYVSEVSARISLECKWPEPPTEPPFTRCVAQLCEVISDGKYYQ